MAQTLFAERTGRFHKGSKGRRMADVAMGR